MTDEGEHMRGAHDLLSGLLAALSRALVDTPWTGAHLSPLADSGLAHHHVDLVGHGVLARIPKQSQLHLDAMANLTYQSACFDRASASGHAPTLHAVIDPRAGLPRGALVVERIDGRPARLPGDLPAIATALARIHALPLPVEADRAPLRDDADPLLDLGREIGAQAEYLDAARLDPRTRALIDSEITTLDSLISRPERPHRRLIAFDAHPGNFVIRPDGSAVLVDLEKCRYSYPSLDLAHATLYTSTTWEAGSSTVLGTAELGGFLDRWTTETGQDGASGWHVPLRRAMWLWSATWSAKWRVLSSGAPAAGADGEDWAAGNSTDALTAHVRDRVDHYLAPEVVRSIVADFDELEAIEVGRLESPGQLDRLDQLDRTGHRAP